MITENGWPNCSAAETDNSPVPGTNIRVPYQRGIPNKVLKAFAADYHRYIEPLRQHDIGGWTPTNDVRTSNHLGGTATDLCWQLHPFRKPGTFTAEQMVTIRQLLEFYEKNVFWGGDWKNPIDEMHWQMGYDTYQNPRVQDFISRKIRSDGFSSFRKEPLLPRKPVVPGPGGTYWCDVSQYQAVSVNDTYPHRVFSFRTNSGSKEDTLVGENAQHALDMLKNNKLDIAIPYYFFRPGQANCDLHKQILEDADLWAHPRTVTMVDVEGDQGSVSGNNSREINDEVNRMRSWYGNPSRVIGYYNPNADPTLWPDRGGINLVIPQYGRKPGDISSVRNEQAKVDAFAHQFTSTDVETPPWRGRSVDVNWSPYSASELLVLFGIQEMEEDELSEVADLVRDIHKWLSEPVDSESIYKTPGEKAHWTMLDMLKHINKFSHEAHVQELAGLGVLSELQRVVRVAAGEGADRSPEAMNRARAVLAAIPTESIARAQATQRLGM